MDCTWTIRQGKVLFVTDSLWLQGCKPCKSIVGTESTVRVYRGSLQPDVDGMTRNLGTTVVVPD
jgi:hypothetical protein